MKEQQKLLKEAINRKSLRWLDIKSHKSSGHILTHDLFWVFLETNEDFRRIICCSESQNESLTANFDTQQSLSQAAFSFPTASSHMGQRAQGGVVFQSLTGAERLHSTAREDQRIHQTAFWWERAEFWGPLPPSFCAEGQLQGMKGERPPASYDRNVLSILPHKQHRHYCNYSSGIMTFMFDLISSVDVGLCFF